MKKQNIFNYTLEELGGIVSPKFRAQQIYKWLYIEYKDDFESMSNLPKALREELTQTHSAHNLEIIKCEQSRDGSKKYLFRTHDGHTFESVLIQMREKQRDENG